MRSVALRYVTETKCTEKQKEKVIKLAPPPIPVQPCGPGLSRPGQFWRLRNLGNRLSQPRIGEQDSDTSEVLAFPRFLVEKRSSGLVILAFPDPLQVDRGRCGFVLPSPCPCRIIFFWDLLRPPPMVLRVPITKKSRNAKQEKLVSSMDFASHVPPQTLNETLGFSYQWDKASDAFFICN